ncbi:hypothetical protein JCGZ_20672 [Jatropha curcas]|uniref:DUF4378 domain-containing protein n=1 Tax=Jatropha curcas TaxID=180498 RepID=A0A067JNF3_JATCU|nr:uncharacterized protein LOC105645885 [Jatropha curcas]KDP25516.1 hypothetical protein JCGZ_20672 [Jatropha curcas]
MASTINQTPYLIEKRPLTLKDYLRDDLSSCSSNGFKSFPRRQCCNTVRFLLETDLNTNAKQRRRRDQQIFKRSRSSKAASSTISALQKASEAVINAVKLLPFPSSSSIKTPSPSVQTRTRKGGILLPRSLSRKLFKKSFWRKDSHTERQDIEIKRWRLFREFLAERDKPSGHSSSTVTTAFTTTGLSRSSSSNSWTESEFTRHSGNSESYSCRNAAAEGEKDLPSEKKVSGGVGVAVGEDAITHSVENTKEWPNEEEKEQFSPVSVLDCPFQDEEEISSPFHTSLVRMEGAKKKLMAKIRTFESLDQLKPLNLEKQIELADLEDDSLDKFSTQACSLSNEVEKCTEREADELLKLVKATTPSNSKADTMLLDFFKEKILENNTNDNKILGYKEFKKELEAAQDWINGDPKEMILGWEVKDNRHIYIKDMERNGKWRNFGEEKEELVLELELEVFTSLVDEALLDLLIS